MVVREKQQMKGIQIGKGDIKLSQFADDMILYIENPKDATRKLLKIINEFSKVARYKINTHISCICALTMKDQKEKLKKQYHLSSHQN